MVSRSRCSSEETRMHRATRSEASEPWPLVLGIAGSLCKLAGVHAKCRGKLASGRHMGLSLVALQPRHGVQRYARFLSELPLGKRLLNPQSFELVSDIDHGLHCSHLQFI